MINLSAKVSASVDGVLSVVGNALRPSQNKWQLAYEVEHRRANTLQMMLEDEQERALGEREMFFRYMGILPASKQTEEPHPPRKPIYTYKSRARKIAEAELRSRLEVVAQEVAEVRDTIRTSDANTH